MAQVQKKTREAIVHQVQLILQHVQLLRGLIQYVSAVSCMIKESTLACDTQKRELLGKGDWIKTQSHVFEVD